MCLRDLRLVLVCTALFLVPGGLRAHIPEKLVIDLHLQENSWEATSEMDVKFAVVALMHHYLPPDTGSGWIDNLNAGQIGLVRELTEKLYRERFQFAVGGERVEMSFSFPDYESTAPEFPLGENDEPVVRVVMKGKYPYPAGEGPLTVKWNARWGPTLVLLVRRPGGEKKSPPVLVAGLGETIALTAPSTEQAASKSQPAGFLAWVGLGIQALLVRGPVHVLFLLGLLLLVRKSKALLTQVVCFTLAHSLAFWLVMLGILEVPIAIVPPFLAIGVVYIGIENLFLKEASPWRLGVVSGLGLVHGIGFAGVLQEFSLARERALLPSAGYHLGLELAQILIIVLAVLVAAPLLKQPLFAKVRVLGSVALVSVGLFWSARHLF